MAANSSLAYKLDLACPGIHGVAQKCSEKAHGTNEWGEGGLLETPRPALHFLSVGVLCVHMRGDREGKATLDSPTPKHG